MNNQELLKEIIKRKDVRFLAKQKFGIDLTRGQEEIVRKIAFRESKRLSVSAMTRYGKTQCVAIGIALLIDFNIPVKIAFIGPHKEQAGILRQYMAELIFKDPSLLSKAQINVKGESRLMKEASRKRQTFKTGAEYRVFTADREGEGMMGFGADIIVPDEACLIKRDSYTKMMRMLGDNPEEGVIIELFNPWDRDNKAFEHTLDPEWDKIRIGWKQALEEGRTSKKFIDEQAKELGGENSIEFTILYKSEFPLEAEDSLYNLKKIEEAEQRDFDLEKEDGVKKIIACDPADKGMDETVIMWGYQKENRFQLIGFYSEAKSESMNIVGKIIEKSKEFIGDDEGMIKIDRIGIGTGALSRLQELVYENNWNNIHVQGCHFGEKAIKADHFMNKKAENYFRSRDIFNEDLIRIPKIRKLRNQLVSMKWELSSSSKKKIVDPERSPDFADCLCYFTWGSEGEYLLLDDEEGVFF